jgi:hypothetical protein
VPVCTQPLLLVATNPVPVGTTLVTICRTITIAATTVRDGTFTDTWRWDSAGQMQAALAVVPARAAMSLSRDATARNGEIVDER